MNGTAHVLRIRRTGAIMTLLHARASQKIEDGKILRAVELAVELQLEQAAHLDLANALARQVEEVADLLERDAAAVGDVERAALLQLPRLEVGEVELDAPGVGVDVEVEVVLAG